MVYKDIDKRNAYMREYRRRNPEKVKLWEKKRKRNSDPKSKRKHLDWQNKRRAEHKKKIIQFKKDSSGCRICGWKIHPEILHFHHKDRKTKSFELSGGNIGCRSWKKIKEEIKKCELLCPNCHSWMHYKSPYNYIIIQKHL